ncbi:MAG: sulfotransferase family protein [SAR92 clade bacterium]|uniref:Sulfotransferase family protein n=1 Tax=SAR92 clade bacterium TaxID=2315479 RepID=A0A520MEX3_9GAMM|nr:MAG: sulfotransferase family protein [SAR92 clade bacterium]
MQEASATEAALDSVKKLMQAGDFGKAEKQLLKMHDEVEKNDDVLYMLAVCQRYLSKHSSALATLEKLKSLVPEHSRAFQETGHVYRAMNNAGAALNAFSRATQINPALAASFRAQIDILTATDRSHLTGQLKQQLESLEALPKPLVAVTDLIAQGKLIKAEQLCKAFMQKVPRNIEGMRLLADIGSRLGVLEDAEFLLESAVEFAPDHTKARIDYIQVLRKRQNYQESLRQAKLLLDTDPSNPQFQSVFAVESMQSGDYDTALSMFESILKILPEDPVTLTSRGHALKTQGQTEDAIDSYRRAIKKYAAHGEAYYSLANLKLFSFSDEEIQAMEAQESNLGISHQSRIYLNFALGKAYEDKGLFDKAFMFYERGNAFKKSQSRYKASDLTAEFKAQTEVFDDAFIASHANTGFTSPDPIFIVGLPRSGSTLLEQILASHSQVDGTMELPNMLALAQKLRRGERMSAVNHYPGILKELPAEQFLEFGEKFIDETRVHRGSAPFFIDKMPNNFRHVGLIKLMLPNAKIIDARRHPMGSCFSGFKQLFAEGQEFTYGLEEVGTYYRDYVELMDHWDKVLPGQVLRVQYEEVVADLDTQVRRILDYCGLEFEESCINFHETDRSVRTPSSEQVRQPIYQSGIEQWKNFESNLDPLKQALGPMLERYPI